MSSAQEINNARFNEEAAAWDSNKKHVETTDKAYEAIMKYVPAFEMGEGKTLDVLEIGCGTGLLSFKLAPHVRSLVGVDTSDGMISAFNTKVASLPDSPAPNLCAINHLLHCADDTRLQSAAGALAMERGEVSSPPYAYRFDLVISHLTLHHVPNMAELMGVLMKCLKHGGMLALTDYEDFGEQAIRFHPEKKRPGVERHGIKRAEMEEILVGTGYNEVRVERAFSLRKEVAAEGERPEEEMEFPFLMCFGVKSGRKGSVDGGRS